VADVQPNQIRIGDAERQSALTALGEHMTAGRMDIDEYGDRTAQVAAAKTRADLQALFADLPAPHPSFGVVPPPEPPRTQPRQQPVPVQSSLPLRARLAYVSLPAAIAIAVVVHAFAPVGTWVFLLPVLVVIFSRVMWGDAWKHERRLARERYRQQRREIRRYRDW
jgi:hypothetical protein